MIDNPSNEQAYTEALQKLIPGSELHDYWHFIT
jgi:hypothetical protein